MFLFIYLFIFSNPSSCSNPSSPEDNSKCLFCKSGHALDYCDSLRSRPYPERIQFLMSKNLYFGCLSNYHTARNCPERKTCSFLNCTKKHPSVLHINSTLLVVNRLLAPQLFPRRTRRPSAFITGWRAWTRTRETLTGGARFAEIGMVVVPVKVWTKGSETIVAAPQHSAQRPS